MSLQVPTGLSRLVCFICLLIVLLPEVSDAETVKVSTTPLYPAIPWEKQDDDLAVLVRVETPPALSRRAPVDLVAVLDISDSMNTVATPSGKSRLDLLKRAMRFIIKKLEGGDRLAIVAFNDQLVQEYGTGLLDISDDGQAKLRRRVDALTASGSTAFWPGLDKAVKILDERTDGRNRAGFIVLLSDGIETSSIEWSTAGISAEIEIPDALSKYPVHTFGFSSLHDPSALLFIAQESRGTYSFINENLDRITGAFAVCLGGLKTVVAIDTRITLTAPKHSGVQIMSIQSGGYMSRVSGDRASGEIVIGVLYAGEVKNFIVRLHVPSVSEHRQQLLLHTRAATSYSSSVVQENGAGVALSVHRPDALAVHQQVRSPVVVTHIIWFKLVKLVVRFAKDLDKVAKDLDKVAKDLDKVATTIDGVKGEELANTLQQRWEEFKEAQNINLLSGVDVWRLEADITAMVSGLRHGGGSGVAFIYSWVSSHQMQRATTMGSPEKVTAEFLTLEMEAMLKESESPKKPPVKEEPVPLPPPRRQPEWDIVDDDIEELTTCGSRVRGDDQDMMDRRLQLWSKLKRELPLMFRATEDAESRDLTDVYREASLEAINRAMQRDVYLAVVHESTMRRCYSGRAGREESASSATAY